MDVQQLRCFLAVAEELHFGRAAERLHLTPSPVSRAVKDLERELGVELFVRRYHQVELTSGGTVLVARVRGILEQVDGLKEAVHQASATESRVVRVGGTHLCPPAVMDRFVAVAEQRFPAHPVDVTMAPSAELLPALERGELEAVLVHLPLDRLELDSLVVARYMFAAAMRADDPLAGAPELTLKDFAHRTLTVGPPTPQPVAMNRLHQRLKDAGITSFHQMPDNDSVMLASHVRRSHGLTLTLDPRNGGSASVFDDPAFAVVPIRENLEFLLGVAWRRSRVERDPLVSGLVAAMREEWAGQALTL
ncbi:LysR family transcriptional regulator [Nonomuraea sp. NEAU-A123]|uniref:LysR family transcriptional regulator n=1 Tax=Nonomuraea sp. NEAU-A123 TaxID=2839649 RepID=UPI001BE4CFAC|nr:LysR family transcriptional regulator [Nonomuraea sp. NEAU-A123]MBT2231953.1 LysR family transcriptional regulator [Nonomuraea sp. NEAU-A123]